MSNININNKKSLVVIPARFNSTRLEAKALLRETGKYLVQHVYEQAIQSHANKIIIATDDMRIKDVVQSFGGEAILTSSGHPTGTDRVAEVSALFPEYDIVVNLQGDEPEVDPKLIDTIIAIQKEQDSFMSTLCCPFDINNYQNCNSPSSVKVVLGQKIPSKEYNIKQALYFSRSLIPFYRANNQSLNCNNQYFMHIGIYAYSRASLAQFVKLPTGKLESIESLEQLRILEHSLTILCGIVTSAHVGIDTREDYDLFIKRYNKSFA